MNKKPQTLDPKIMEGWDILRAEAERGSPSRTRSLTEHFKEEKRNRSKIDGRSLRKTGRTEQFNFRVKAATKTEIQKLADTHGWLLGEVIEQAIAALKEKLHRTK